MKDATTTTTTTKNTTITTIAAAAASINAAIAVAWGKTQAGAQRG